MRLDQLYPISQTIDIKDGLGEKTDVKFQLVGPNSKQYMDMFRVVSKTLQGKADDENFTDLVLEGNYKIVAACVIGWEGLEDENGSVSHSPEKAYELISNPELTFLREQVEAAFAERAKFFRKSKKTT
jgi:hypothetical protein